MYSRLESYAWIVFLSRIVACGKVKVELLINAQQSAQYDIAVMDDVSWEVCPPLAQVPQDQCVGASPRFLDRGSTLHWNNESGKCFVESGLVKDWGQQVRLVCVNWYRNMLKTCSPLTDITYLDECLLAVAAVHGVPPTDVGVIRSSVSGILQRGCAFRTSNRDEFSGKERLKTWESDRRGVSHPQTYTNAVKRIIVEPFDQRNALSRICRRITTKDIAAIALRELQEPTSQKRISGACRLAYAGIEGAKNAQQLLNLLKEGVELQQAAAAALAILSTGTDDVVTELEKQLSKDSIGLLLRLNTIGKLRHTAVQSKELRNWVRSTELTVFVGATYLYNYALKVSSQRHRQAQKLLSLLALPIVVFVTCGFATLLWHVRRRIPIVDISMKSGKNVLTTIGRHGMIRDCGVVLTGTGVPWLDNPSAQIRAHVLGTQRLALHVEIDTVVDNSHGDCLEIHMVNGKMKIKSVKSDQTGSAQLFPRVGDQILCIGRNRANCIEPTQGLLKIPLCTLRLKLLRDLERCDTSMGTIHQPSLGGFVNAGFLFPSCIEAALCFAVGIACGWSLPPVSIFNTSLPPSLHLPDVSAWWGLLIASVFLALPVLYNRARAGNNVPIKAANSEYFQILRSGNPRPQCTERGPPRAITSEQLMNLFNHYESFIKDRTMYYLDKNVIRPLTSTDKMSFSEVAGPSLVEWFVSHYWGTAFCHFVQTIYQHSRAISGAQWGNCSYWICSFSNNQWRVESEVGATLEESSFYLALHSHSCQGTTMVMDELALPLTRSWCCFEVLHTCLLQDSSPYFKGLFLCTSSGVLNFGATGIDVAMAIGHRLATLSVQEANASHPEDKLKIDASIIEMMKTFEAMDDFLRSNVRNCLHAARARFERDFEELHHLLDHERVSEIVSVCLGDSPHDEGAMSTLRSRMSVRMQAHARDKCQSIESASVPSNFLSTIQSAARMSAIFQARARDKGEPIGTASVPAPFLSTFQSSTEIEMAMLSHIPGKSFQCPDIAEV